MKRFFSDPQKQLARDIVDNLASMFLDNITDTKKQKKIEGLIKKGLEKKALKKQNTNALKMLLESLATASMKPSDDVKTTALSSLLQNNFGTLLIHMGGSEERGLNTVIDTAAHVALGLNMNEEQRKSFKELLADGLVHEVPLSLTDEPDVPENTDFRTWASKQPMPAYANYISSDIVKALKTAGSNPVVFSNSKQRETTRQEKQTNNVCENIKNRFDTCFSFLETNDSFSHSRPG